MLLILIPSTIPILITALKRGRARIHLPVDILMHIIITIRPYLMGNLLRENPVTLDDLA